MKRIERKRNERMKEHNRIVIDTKQPSVCVHEYHIHRHAHSYSYKHFFPTRMQSNVQLRTHSKQTETGISEHMNQTHSIVNITETEKHAFLRINNIAQQQQKYRQKPLSRLPAFTFIDECSRQMQKTRHSFVAVRTCICRPIAFSEVFLFTACDTPLPCICAQHACSQSNCFGFVLRLFRIFRIVYTHIHIYFIF